MPDFGKFSNYTPETAFSSVVFGAQAPVLEVEMNELQEIFNNKLKLLSTMLGDSIVVGKNGSLRYDIDSMELTMVNCVAISEGFITLIPSASVVLSADNTVAYLRLTETIVTGEDPITAYGKTDGEVIENPIIDPRVGVETSRRKVISYSLECSDIMPENVPNTGIVFIKVGVLSEIKVDDEGNPVAPGTLGFSSNNTINNLSETLTNIENNVTNLVENPEGGMTVTTAYADGRLSLTFTGNKKPAPEV